MISPSKLSKWGQNLREIYLFTDTHCVELALVLTQILINPFEISNIPGVPIIWCLAGIIGALINGYGLLDNNLAYRYWGIKLIWLYLIVMIVQCAWCWCWSTDMNIFIIQLIVTWFVMWKTRKQLKFCRTRKDGIKKCQG